MLLLRTNMSQRGGTRHPFRRRLNNIPDTGTKPRSGYKKTKIERLCNLDRALVFVVRDDLSFPRSRHMALVTHHYSCLQANQLIYSIRDIKKLFILFKIFKRFSELASLFDHHFVSRDIKSNH